jgi:hypothetical protein
MRSAKKTRAVTVAGVMLASVVGPLAGQVGAAPLEKGHFHDVGSEPQTLCGLDVQHDFDVKGSYRFVPHGRDGLAYFGDNVHGTESWTNLDTLKSLSHRFTFSDRDTKVTDNGDGTLTIEAQAQGGDTYYDTNGDVLFRDPGQTRFTIVVDHGGTPADPSDDEEVSFEIRRESTGRNDTQGRDFCEDLNTFTA